MMAAYNFTEEPVGSVDWELRGELLRLSAPHWYQVAGFMEWVRTNSATWHNCNGNTEKEPHEFSDVFTWYSYGDGSDAPVENGYASVPEEVWSQISEVVRAATGSKETEILLWISNT